MKKLILLISVVMLIGAAVLYSSVPTYTLTSKSYEPSRFSVQVNSVTEDDLRLDNTTTYWSGINNFITIDPSWDKIRFAFYGYGDGTGIGDPTSGTFSFTIWAALEYSSAQIVYIGTGTCAGGQLSHNPVTGVAFWNSLPDPNYLWADALDANGTNGVLWHSTTADPSNNALMGVMVVETHNYPYWFVQIDDMTGSSVTSVTCVMGKHE